MERLKLFIDKLKIPINPYWLNIFKTNEQISPRFKQIISRLFEMEEKGYRFLPKTEQIFRVFNLDLSQIKVIIVGQDPYPNEGDPDGLAFSSLAKTTPASLSRIFSALIKSKLLKSKPSHNDLTSWFDQGIFLMNNSLTVEPHAAGSHVNLWDGFAKMIVTHIAQNAQSPIIFCLWGSHAQQLELNIFNETVPHKILKWCHPVARASKGHTFSDCDHFSIISKEFNINWNLDKRSEIKEGKQQDTRQQDQKQELKEYFKGKTVWFTDGSCKSQQKNPTSDEWGVYRLMKNGVKNELKIGGTHKASPVYKPTSIQGEGYAILYVLQNLDLVVEKNILYTDSEFWCKMLHNYMPSWEEKNIDFKSKANPHISIPMYEAYKKIKDKIEVIHIPAYHNYKPSNNLESLCALCNRIAEEVAQSYK